MTVFLSSLGIAILVAVILGVAGTVLMLFVVLGSNLVERLERALTGRRR